MKRSKFGFFARDVLETTGYSIGVSVIGSATYHTGAYFYDKANEGLENFKKKKYRDQEENPDYIETKISPRI
ncbi:hypothetical protein [Fluoribacter gormanii]|uniref:hypothetical protein n=1 Tax=Fluoribacter gormanii TaxID=464 RepID=UPI001041989B|nr:hypothetical protein [Fluoribacter gormanii]